MKRRKKKINTKLLEFGKILGLEENEVMRAKRTARNIATMIIVASIFILLGHRMMQSGPVGLYYTGVSIKDFQMLFGGFFSAGRLTWNAGVRLR